MEKTVLITGSNGLIGSEATRFFIAQGFKVIGVDNDMRQFFFGAQASTSGEGKILTSSYPKSFILYTKDIRDKKAIDLIFKKHRPDLVIHTAAQPSHDWAVRDPLTDFSINATATLQLLEAFREFTPEGTFIFTSTNKVYGDRPNTLALEEHATRFELPKKHQWHLGVDESMSVDQTLHSIFGVSKLSADAMVQEYGRYFHLKTVCFRGGCLTGPAHKGTALHGFLSFLVHTIMHDKQYQIYGYKGKQVRDNIHSYDFVQALYEFYKNPKVGGAVYNMGGGRDRSVSILEAIKKIEEVSGKTAKTLYVDTPRIGDHIWYISNVSKFQKDFPNWKYQYSLDQIIKELVAAV